MEHESDDYTNCNWRVWYRHCTENEGLEIKGRMDTIQTRAWLRSVTKLRKDLETFGDLLSLKTPEENPQLTLVGRTLIILLLLIIIIGDPRGNVQKFKFDHTNKWNMHNPTTALENDTHELLWDFDIHTDHLISVRRPDFIIINKKENRICKIVDFAIPADHSIRLKECKKKDKFLVFARELKKNYETWKWRLYQLWLVLLAQ